MKIDFMSDLHADFYFRPDKKLKLSNFKRIFDKYFLNKKSEYLIIAGDIGHYIKQNVILLKLIKEEYGYKEIILVLGNHDYYLISNAQRRQFKDNSFNKVEFSKQLYKDNGFIILDGNMVEIEGKKIAGTAGWYDGSVYTLSNNFLLNTTVIDFWKQVSNDSNYIKGIKDFYDIWEIEQHKLRKVISYDPELIITHFKPVIESRFYQDKYKGDKTNAFYSFNYLKHILNMNNIKYWIYGHSHEREEYELFGLNKHIVCNAFGYPRENKKLDLSISTITI